MTTTYHYWCTFVLKPSINIFMCNVIIAFHCHYLRAVLLNFALCSVLSHHYWILSCWHLRSSTFTFTTHTTCEPTFCNFTLLFTHKSIDSCNSIIFLFTCNSTTSCSSIIFLLTCNFTFILVIRFGNLCNFIDHLQSCSSLCRST